MDIFNYILIDKKIYKILFIFIINIWSILFFVDYVFTQIETTDVYHGIEFKRSGKKSYASFAVFNNYIMPIQSRDCFFLTENIRVKTYIGLFTNIIFKFSYKENNKVVFVFPNSGICVHFIFLPIISVILFIFGIMFLNNEIYYKIAVVNIIFVIIEWICVSIYS